ncbi:MAG: hypothetical protein HOW73_39925 [Polyangiaceae bacterium]|nr:hypothetical protein [Polyangiaceae bacterium]
MIARHAFALVFVAGTSIAPFQCASEPEPQLAKEETPGEALKGLADEFAKSGDDEARIRTLKYIVERYPRSKYAEEAKTELKELGVEFEAPAASASAAAASASAAASVSAAASTSAAP